MNECTAASMPARLIAATIVRMCSLMKTLHSIYSLCSHRMTSDSRPPQLFEQKEKTGRRMIVYNYRLPGGQEYCRQCALGPLAAFRNSSSMLLCSGANGPPCTNTSSAACRSAELYQARLIATCSETAAATPPPSSIDRMLKSSFEPHSHQANLLHPSLPSQLPPHLLPLKEPSSSESQLITLSRLPASESTKLSSSRRRASHEKLDQIFSASSAAFGRQLILKLAAHQIFRTTSGQTSHAVVIKTSTPSLSSFLCLS